ncbi:MAG: ATPase, partial [Muribaculaceae bacterium]|nr:ATPase [Muribaculaceae bacterium]
MILIADCGSTKIDWCLLNNGKVEKQVFTLGMNAVMLTEEEMRTRIGSELVPELAEYSDKVK